MPSGPTVRAFGLRLCLAINYGGRGEIVDAVRRIAADPDRLELGGEEREMTVMFCDVRNFSGISEHLAPRQVIGFLIGTTAGLVCLALGIGLSFGGLLWLDRIAGRVLRR